MDIRLHQTFWTHFKTEKLKRKLGSDAIVCLLRLWSWAGENRHNGNLESLDFEDINIASGWTGKDDFVSTLIEIGFLDETKNGLSIHGWEEHQPWVFMSKQRSETAKKNARARWEKKYGKCDSHTDGIKSACDSHADCNAQSNAPNPSPNPTPSPSPNPNNNAESNQFSLVPDEQEPTLIIHEDLLELPYFDEDKDLIRRYPKLKAEWSKAYPAVDIPMEIRNAHAWQSADTRRKKIRQVQFLRNWLATAQQNAWKNKKGESKNGNGTEPRKHFHEGTPEDFTKFVEERAERNLQKIRNGKKLTDKDDSTTTTGDLQNDNNTGTNRPESPF